MPTSRLFYVVLTFVFATIVSGSYGNIERACKALQSALPDQINFPDSTGFKQSIDSYAYANLRLQPTCIVSPKSAEDVSKTVRILVKHPSVEFAIRSGGHNTNEGFANTNNGITIDLSALNIVQVNETTNTVSIGVGARWSKVYETVERHNHLSVQGGRAGTVGAGGYIVGGGIGYYSPDKGWTCDSVKNFEVVLANGSLITASPNSHADLFKALKGGSNNFGIVTRFDLETIDQGLLTGGSIIYGNASGEQVVDAFTIFKRPDNFDKYAMVIVFLTYNAAQNDFNYVTALYYARPEKFRGSTSEAFTKIEPQVASHITNETAGFFATQVGEITDPAFDPNVQMHWSQVHVHATPTILHRIHSHFHSRSLSTYSKYPNTNFTVTILMQSVPAYKPGNSLGFDPASHPERDLINFLIMFSFYGTSAADALKQELKAFTAEVEDIARKEGALNKFVYLNYGNRWQNVLEGYGRESVSELKQVAKRYDPEGVFQKQFRGGFKLSNVEL